jgi:succinyl-CoA synthetase beta subunit
MLGEALDISRETYLAILMDREFQGPVIVASPEGGVDIEEVAEKTPDKIYKVRFFTFSRGLKFSCLIVINALSVNNFNKDQ